MINKLLAKTLVATANLTFLLKYLEDKYYRSNFVVIEKQRKTLKKQNRDNMKKNIFTIMLLISSTCINTFAEMKTDNNSTYTEDIPIPIKKPIRKSIHQLYIIGYLENGAYTFTFNKALPNAEIKIYRNGFLVEYYCGSFNLGQVYTTNLQGYGNGEYTIEVYNNGNKIFSGSEEI